MKHDGGNTLAVIRNELENAGYMVKMGIFNSNDFGLPQKRNRVIIFARRKQFGDFYFSADMVKEAFGRINRKKCSLNFYDSTIDVLDKHVDEKYYLSEKIKPTLLSDGSAGFKSKSEIDQVIARPLTATMHKMHRACQDNYFSQGFINGEYEGPTSGASAIEMPIRRITPREAFRLQGFPERFVSNIESLGLSDSAMYKLAGNAVSVNVVYAILDYLSCSFNWELNHD
jgi:DNA (cytosine-5)-methyltransferase 1